MKKGWIFGGLGALVLLILIFVAVVAMNVGSEASKMDSMLKADISRHASVVEVKKQLGDAGYAVQGDTPKVTAVGPKHSLVVYTTWLTLELGFDPAGALTSYHLDRAS